MVLMGSRAHRWPGDNSPLSDFHGGTKEAALRAIAESRGEHRPKPPALTGKKLAARERARAIAQEQIERLEQLISKLPPVPRKDKLRPRANKPQPATAAERKSMLREHYAQQGGKCAYCKASMTRRPIEAEKWRRVTLDHVVPLSKGGPDTIHNTVAACMGCNQAKADLSAEAFLADMRNLRMKGGYP